MKLKNVKSGVRVELKVDAGSVKAGQQGVLKPSVYAGPENCWVYFEDYVNGWGDSEHGIPIGHGWTVPIKDLRRIKE